jgi:hypothetical protein
MRSNGDQSKQYISYHFSDMCDEQPLSYLWKGGLNGHDIGLVHGDPGSGKSFAMLDLSMSIARGIYWLGHRTRSGLVCYLAAESAHGFRNCIAAYVSHHELTGDMAREIPFHIIPASPKLSGGDDCSRLISTLRQIAKSEAQPVKLLVIDTLSAVLQGADENSSEGMGALLASAKSIRAEIGCAVVLVHHDSKAGKDARGHSSLKGDTDCILQVKRTGEVRSIVVNKSKEGCDGACYDFKLNVIELGTDDDGDPITSCVVEPMGESVTSKKSEPKGQASIALKLLRDAILKSGELLPSSDNIPTNVMGVSLQLWKEYCANGLSNGESATARRNAFNRAKETLLKHRHIGTWGDYVWIPLQLERHRHNDTPLKGGVSVCVARMS